MKSRSGVGCVAHLILFFTWLPLSLADVYAANMTGVAEVGFGYKVPDNYLGNAVFTFHDLNNGSTVIAFTFTQSGLDPILQIVLERQTDPTNGVLVLDFTPVANLGSLYTNGTTHGQALMNTTLAIGVEEKAEIFFINVKTKNYSPGAIRGPLVDVTPSPVNGQLPTAVLVSNLTSSQVVPAFSGPSAGSAETEFDFYTLTNKSAYMEFGFRDLGNITEIASVSIHNGGLGLIGPSILNLTQYINMDAFDYNGFAFGAIALPADVAFKIINDPATLYVQISTANMTLRE